MSLYINVYQAGIGNHLFTIASAYGLARKHHKQLVVIDTAMYDPHSRSNHDWLYDKLVLTKNVPRGILEVDEKPNRCCSIDPNVVHLVQSTEHIRVKGYLQCEGYFKGYYDDICTLFEPPDQIIKNIGTKYPTFETDSYFMHIRLGDYLSSHGKPAHFINLSHYYVKCLGRLHNQGAKIYVFSNECVDKCVHIYPILQTLKDRLVFINEPDQLTTLRLMTMCSLGGICANSSFSWWGAYLNKNPTKEVYMPSEWINNKHIHNDIYFPNVQVVSV